MVSDFGWAILIAVSNVFAKCIDLRDYLQKCYAIVVSNNISGIPSCYIRLDVSHLIRMITRWKCLKGNEKILVRIFFLRCIGQAYKMSSFKELEYFIESLLCVALSKSIGCAINGKPLESDLRMQYLNDIIKDNVNVNNIKTFINENNDEMSENDSLADDVPNEELNIDCTDWIEWSDSVLDSAKKIAENATYGNVINACYNPEFAEQIRTRLLPYVPL